MSAAMLRSAERFPPPVRPVPAEIARKSARGRFCSEGGCRELGPVVVRNYVARTCPRRAPSRRTVPHFNAAGRSKTSRTCAPQGRRRCFRFSCTIGRRIGGRRGHAPCHSRRLFSAARPPPRCRSRRCRCRCRCGVAFGRADRLKVNTLYRERSSSRGEPRHLALHLDHGGPEPREFDVHLPHEVGIAVHIVSGPRRGEPSFDPQFVGDRKRVIKG